MVRTSASDALKALAASVGERMKELREIVSPKTAKPKEKGGPRSSAPHIPVASSQAQVFSKKGKARGRCEHSCLRGLSLLLRLIRTGPAVRQGCLFSRGLVFPLRPQGRSVHQLPRQMSLTAGQSMKKESRKMR